MTDSLSDALPDLVVMVKRDGVILSHMGGRGVAVLALPRQAADQRLGSIWPDSIAACVKQAVRRAIAQRAMLDTSFTAADVRYEMRTTPQGPDRALCVIRAAGTASATDETAGPADLAQSRFDRRGFLSRFHDNLSEAVIQEGPGGSRSHSPGWHRRHRARIRRQDLRKGPEQRDFAIAACGLAPEERQRAGRISRAVECRYSCAGHGLRRPGCD